jgi:hypothetical protein
LLKAELYRRADAKFIKDGEPSAIAKEYISLAVIRKKQYFIRYRGADYSGGEVGKLLEGLNVD